MELRLAAHPASASRGRHWVSFLARQHGAGPDQVHTIELLTSELVTNALRRAARDDVVVLSLRREQSAITVTVTSGVPAEAAPVTAPGLAADGEGADGAVPRARGGVPVDADGAGVGLVAALSSEWGVTPVDDRHRAVWFRLALRSAA